MSTPIFIDIKVTKQYYLLLKYWKTISWLKKFPWVKGILFSGKVIPELWIRASSRIKSQVEPEKKQGQIR